MNARALSVALVLALATVGLGGPTRADADPDRGVGAANRANAAIVALDFEKAHAELTKADPDSPSVMVAQARLALYEGDCDLGASVVARKNYGDGDEAGLVADVLRGCARVTAATVVESDESAGVVVRFQDESDRALMPFIVDTVKQARASLTRDLGVEWKLPTRITVVRDLLSLSAMTGLPYKSAKATGTAAVAKWGRVTMLSPRASYHGYPWRDTLAHELTHLAISMQTRERAPLWLHEGMARRQETRWRDPGPFDDRPSAESVVLRGMDLKLDLPLDRLGPSIAMLPSADAAMVAYAEVASFVRFYVESQPEGALSKLLLALRDAKDVDDALKQASGQTLGQWDARWRAQLAHSVKEPLSPLYGLGGAPPNAVGAREKVRLAELLTGRGHPAEGLLELDKIAEPTFADPSVRYRKARVLEAKGEVAEAEALVADPSAWIAAFGPCWALRARLARSRNDTATASSASAAAFANDPLSEETACPSLDRSVPGGGPVCDAARKREEPDFGKD